MARIGNVEAIEALPSTFTAGPPAELVLRYTVRGSEEAPPARVMFQREGVRMRLLGFGVPDKK